MKRQTEQQLGVVSLWAATPLNPDPFHLSARYQLQKSGIYNSLFHNKTQITLSSCSILFENRIFGKTISCKRLNISEFQGVALRISAINHDIGQYAISINLHHKYEQFCIPLFLAFDMQIVSARIQTWSRRLRLPILLPTPDGNWKQAENRLGLLKIGPPIQRCVKNYIKNRKGLLPGYRETGTLGTERKVYGKELFARN